VDDDIRGIFQLQVSGGVGQWQEYYSIRLHNSLKLLATGTGSHLSLKLSTAVADMK